MFEKGNEAQKKKFFDRLYEVTGKPTPTSNKNTNDHFDTAHKNFQNERNKQRFQQNNEGSSSATLGLGLAGLCGILGLFWYSSIKSHSKKIQSVQSSQKDVKILGQEDVDRISEKTERDRLEKANAMIKSIVKDHPPSLKFPDEDPPLMTQLTQYSIAPDIHLYEVDPKYFKDEEKESVVQKGINPSDAFELTRIKPNTTLTLSLEAERTLQNTYVKVKDVIK